MILLIIAVNTLVFLALSVIHIYWAFGGKRAVESTLPTTPDGQFLFKPGLLSTLVVALGLLIFAVITVGDSGVLDPWIDRPYFHFGTWAITLIFTLRAIGDFNFIGFTKKIKGTQFARNDSKIYSPLCLGIASFSFLIVIFSP